MAQRNVRLRQNSSHLDVESEIIAPYSRFMITEFGHFALILAFMVALLQSSLPLIGASLNRHGLMAFAMPAATAQFVLVLAAFGALTHAFVTSDFSVQLVVLNSHSAETHDL